MPFAFIKALGMVGYSCSREIFGDVMDKFEVVMTDDGEEAVELATKLRPDVMGDYLATLL